MSLRGVLILASSFLGLSGLAAAQERAGQWIEIRAPHFTVVSDAGEKDAKRVANQFEQIRALFHDRFASLRVDDGRPFVVIAARNENSLKAFVPEYWEKPGGIKPVGVFVSGFDGHFAMIRTDVSGTAENPYQVVYHEYTHALLRLNFQSLPLWINEGLAQFYGNTIIGDKQADVGRVTANQLRLLLAEKLIRIDDLMKVDEKSPYYRESDQATVFYPESWALMHYLLSDPDALRQDLLGRYLAALDASGDTVQAARQTFGDLEAFQRRLEQYVRQPNFYVQRRAFVPTSDAQLTIRSLTSAQALVKRAEVLQRTGRVNDAATVLAQVAQTNPQLPDVHTAIAFSALQQQDRATAEREFREALRLGAADFRPHYFVAMLTAQRDPGAAAEVATELERALAVNPDFAPASAFLAQVYRQLPETRAKAVDAAVRAVRLEPAVFAYRLGLGETLLALRRFDEARSVGAGLVKMAQTTEDKAAADNFMKRVVAAAEPAR